MNPPNKRLDAITTRWSLIRQAHAKGDRSAEDARKVLVLRYAASVRGYIGGIVKNREDADELSQEVVVRLLKGDFAGADPTRGRFRDLLKTAVRNMVRNFWAKQNRRKTSDLDPDALPAAGDDAQDQAWLGVWQKNVLDHTMNALKEFERENPGNPAHTILRIRTEFPDETSDQMAARLSAVTGTAVRADACRQILRRSRLRFAEFLIEEIRLGLDDDTPDRIEEELAALGLLDHVRDFLPDDWKTRGNLVSE